MTLTAEAQDLLRNPRGAINLAKGGSQQHALAIADTIHKRMAHLRPKALEALLVNCVKEEGNLGLSDALVLCIERLEEDLLAYYDSPDPPSKRHRYRSARASSGTVNRRELERLIVQHSATIRKALQVYDKAWLTKEGIGASRGVSTLERRIVRLGACFKVLASNDAIGPVLFKEPDIMRFPIRFWFATVLESEPGKVNPVVHEALWACYNTEAFDQEDFLNLLVKEKNGELEACDIAALFVSELRHISKKKAESYTLGTDALVRLNMLLVGCSDPVTSLRRASLGSNAITILTKAVRRVVQRGNRTCVGTASIAFLIGVHCVLVERDGVRWAVDVLKAGLLAILAETETFTSCDCLNEEFIDTISHILHPFLTQHLVHYSVVRAAVNAMSTISSENIKQLKVSPFLDAWHTFRSILLERSVFVSRLYRKIPSLERMMYCEYCLKEFHIRALRKCAECKRTLYCSKSCQKLDWRDGDHKQRCMENVSQNYNSAPLRTLDRFFMGHLACYDIRRHMSSLLRIIPHQLPNDPLDELYVRIQYDTVESPMAITVSPLSCIHSEISSRVRRLPKGHQQPFGSRLVEVRYYGRDASEDTFYCIFPESYFVEVPKLRDGFPSEWARASIRSNARCLSCFVLEDGLSDVPISSDPDEVGAILGFMDRNRGSEVRSDPFPLTFEYDWEDIEVAAAECRRCRPFDCEGIL